MAKDLGVLILDKVDWLLPEYGPGDAYGDCNFGFGSGNVGEASFSDGNGSGEGDGKQPYSRYINQNGCGWGDWYNWCL